MSSKKKPTKARAGWVPAPPPPADAPAGFPRGTVPTPAEGARAYEALARAIAAPLTGNESALEVFLRAAAEVALHGRADRALFPAMPGEMVPKTVASAMPARKAAGLKLGTLNQQVHESGGPSAADWLMLVRAAHEMGLQQGIVSGYRLRSDAGLVGGSKGRRGGSAHDEALRALAAMPAEQVTKEQVRKLAEQLSIEPASVQKRLSRMRKKAGNM